MRAPWLWPLALVAMLIAVARGVSVGESFFLRDFWINYLPARELARDLIAGGDLPLWNHWIGGGLPILAEPNAALLYPPSWPVLLVANQAWALSAFALLHNLVAALGTYGLARRSASRPGALIAALGFGFGGLMLSNLLNLHWHFAYAWVPLWFLALLRLLERGRAGERGALPGLAAQLGLIWALQLTAGEPQIVYLEGLAALLAIGAEWARGRDRRGLAAGPWLAGAAVAASCAAALQLWPMWEAIPLTARAVMGDAAAGQWSLHPLRLWELVLPSPWGHVTPYRVFWATIANGPIGPSFYFTSLYAGGLALPALLLGCRSLHRRDAVWIVGALLLLVAAAGELTPLHGVLRRLLPVWDLFRYPERLVLLPMLGALLLVARGVDRLLVAPRRAWPVLVVAPALVVVAILSPTWVGVAPAPPAAAEVHRAAIHAGGMAIVIPLALLLGPRWRPGALALVVAVDLLALGPLIQPTWRPPASSPPALSGMTHYDTPAIERAIDGLFDPIARRDFEARIARPNANVAHRRRSSNGRTSLRLRRVRRLEEAVGRERADQLRGAQNIITHAKAPLTRYVPGDELEPGLVRFTLPALVPEVECSTAWSSAPNLEQASQMVGDGLPVTEGEGCRPPEQRLERAAPVVEPEPEPEPPAAEAAAVEQEPTAPPAPEGTASEPPAPCRWQRRDNGDLTVELPPAAQTRLLTIHQNFWPGWQATTQDGSPLPICPTDVASTGVRVPAGVETVTLRYRPAWLLPLAALSAGGWLTLLVAASWRRRHRRRARDGNAPGESHEGVDGDRSEDTDDDLSHAGDSAAEVGEAGRPARIDRAGGVRPGEPAAAGAGDDLERRWAITRELLAEACRRLPAEVVEAAAGTALAGYREYLGQDELELALDALAAVGRSSAASPAFWQAWHAVAEQLGVERAERPPEA